MWRYLPFSHFLVATWAWHGWRVTITPEQLTDLADAVPAALRARDAAIVDATRQGMKQTTIVGATGLSREQVRRIVRAAGVGPE